MKTEDPLLAAWEATLVQLGDQPAIFDAQGRILFRFGEIEERSRRFDALQDFASGEIVAVQLGNHPDWPAVFLACLRREIVVLPLEPSMAERERRSALQGCQVAGLITTPEGPIQRVGTGDAVDWGNRPPVLLKLTSGTTAEPRAIRFRSHQLRADATQICDTMGFSSADLNFGVIPLSHSYGFSNLVTPLLVRGVPMAISVDRMPRAVLDNVARTGATVFPGMPVFFQAFNEMTQVPALPKLRLCISAGAPLTRTVARKFQEKFGLPIHSFYGASECGGICYDRPASSELEGFVGTPLQDVELDRLETGEGPTQIRVRSAGVGDGYFPAEERARLSDGSFVPDDLVTMDREGVRIVGRISDVINVAGKKVNPAEVEAHLLAFPGIRQAVVFGRASSLRHQEVVACVVGSEETDEAVLLEFCRERLSGWQVPKRIFLLDALPTTERGKISRRALAERFSA
jgi:long-chain acyl-CoA synthetase